MVVRRKRNELYHYGIKGQKRGKRRFQYANKTYTPEGNARYRPKKGAAAALAATAVFGAALAKSAGAVGTGALTAKLAAIGASAVSAIMSIPAPVFALTLPFAVMAAAAGAVKAKEALKEIGRVIF